MMRIVNMELERSIYPARLFIETYREVSNFSEARATADLGNRVGLTHSGRG